MLIYNYKKEFLGIDAKDLKTLGFENLAGLRSEVNDFADLFVKTPGFIHNFKHVHWIDFITCADSNEESKVIINVNNKNYRSVIQITSAFLVDEPSAPAYLVSLNNLRELTQKENENISGDIVERPVIPTEVQARPIITAPSVQKDAYDIDEGSPALMHDPYASAPQLSEEEVSETLEEELPLEIELDDALNLDIPLDDDLSLPIEETPQTEIRTTTLTQEFDNGYTYDPTVASDELGLPLDLIEEFIQDFINQAKEFKSDLYKSLDEGDIDNLKILSHKLKGVAANLRIEDALEVLVIINTSSHTSEIANKLDELYHIVAKLAGEKISTEVQTPIIIEDTIETTVEPEMTLEEEIEEEFSLDFKEDSKEEDDLYSDPISIEDIDTPQKIEIPELADDAFLDDDFKIEITMDDEIADDEIKIDIKEEVIEEEVTEPIIQTPITTISYSKKSAAEEIGLDRESFNELFSDYIEELTQIKDSINDALINNDIATAKEQIHKLQSMSENMRVNAFDSELTLINNSTNIEEIQNALSTIDVTITQLSNLED